MNYRKLKRWLRAYCRAHHIDIPTGFNVRVNRWGRYARKLTEQVQAREKLPVTGNPDPGTVRAITPFRVKLMRVVRGELGTKEWPAGSNWGEVKKYLAAAGFDFPTPWCASFVTYCVKKAGWERSLPAQLGWVPSWESWAKAREYTVAKARAKRGDIVTFDWDGDGVGEHIGFVTRNLGLVKQVATIEGNATSAELPGGGVVRKTRLWSQVNAVIRLPNYP